LQGSFSTGHYYRNSLSVRYDFRAGLRAGNDFSFGFTTNYDYRYGLSAGQYCSAGLIAIYDRRIGLLAGHEYRVGLQAMVICMAFQHVMVVWVALQQSIIVGLSFQQVMFEGLHLTPSYDYRYGLSAGQVCRTRLRASCDFSFLMVRLILIRIFSFCSQSLLGYDFVIQ